MVTYRPMRVAVVHDHFLYFGGAERTVFEILTMFPGADLFTAFIHEKMDAKVRSLVHGTIRVSPYNRLVFSYGVADLFKPLVYQWFESLNMSGYDLVVSSSHAFSSKSVRVGLGGRHVSYIYTPPRFLYGWQNETSWIRMPVIRALLHPWFMRLRQKDYQAAQRPDVLIAASQTVQERIRHVYRRNSLVIYPPVMVTDPSPITRQKRQYYLVVSRLVKQKGVDLAIRACNKLHVPLVVVGEGKEERALKRLAGPTVRFLGFVPDEQMKYIYHRAKALLYCSREEDFGLTPLESMAHGVPVIAFRSGGVRESVIDGKTGVLFDEYTLEGLVSAIRESHRRHFSSVAAKRHAATFSRDVFRKRFLSCVADIMKGSHTYEIR